MWNAVAIFGLSCENTEATGLLLATFFEPSTAIMI